MNLFQCFTYIIQSIKTASKEFHLNNSFKMVYFLQCYSQQLQYGLNPPISGEMEENVGYTKKVTQ